MTPTARSRRVLAPIAAVGAVLLTTASLTGCGSDTTVSAQRTSTERSTNGSGADDTDNTDDAGEELPPAGDVSEYCDRAATLQSSVADITEDPAAQVEAIDSLASVAPPELEEHFDVMSDVMDQLSGLDENDPESLGQIFELAFDPEVQTASTAIMEFTERECGFELGTTDTDTDTEFDSADPFADDDPTDLELEDVDAVSEAAAAASQSWADKLSGTLISGGADVQLSADPTQPLTADEALAACTAMWQALHTKNPAVTVEILNGDTVVAASGADGTCALR